MKISTKPVFPVQRFWAGVRVLKFTVCLCVLGALLAGRNTWAVEVRDLYLMEVPVESQSDSARARAVRKGLEQVIVRVTGSSSAADNSYIRQRLAGANDYLQQFSYVTVEEPGADGEMASVRKLKLQFDEILIIKEQFKLM